MVFCVFVVFEVKYVHVLVAVVSVHNIDDTSVPNLCLNSQVIFPNTHQILFLDELDFVRKFLKKTTVREDRILVSLDVQDLQGLLLDL
jgi:hypothetical protein